MPERVCGWGMLAAAFVMAVQPATAQQAFGWGPHFGAIIKPDTSVDRTHFSLDINLFTELAKELLEPGAEFQRYNGIQSTIGVNQFSVQLTKSFPGRLGASRRQRTWHFGVAALDDALTDFLQNDFMHGLMDRPFVPRGATASGMVLLAGLDQSLRYPIGKHFDVFAGAGANTAIGLLAEGYGQAGVTAKLIVDSNGLRRYYGEVTCSGRGGLVSDTDWLVIDEVSDHYADRYWMAQCLLGVDPGSFLGKPGAAILNVGLTRTSGLFRAAPSAGSIHETLVVVRVSLPTYHLVIQTWNDVIASKDQGPTFGVGLSYSRRGS